MWIWLFISIDSDLCQYLYLSKGVGIYIYIIPTNHQVNAKWLATRRESNFYFGLVIWEIILLIFEIFYQMKSDQESNSLTSGGRRARFIDVIFDTVDQSLYVVLDHVVRLPKSSSLFKAETKVQWDFEPLEAEKWISILVWPTDSTRRMHKTFSGCISLFMNLWCKMMNQYKFDNLKVCSSKTRIYTIWCNILICLNRL